MATPLRTAFFPDSFLEVNGVAMTSRKLAAYAQTQGLPFAVVHAGKNNSDSEEGSTKFLELKRSPASFKLDQDLAYDPFFQRHTKTVQNFLTNFQPDVIHITGLNDVSIMGAYLAWKLQVPLLASWHTNLHEFAAQRLRRILRFIPPNSSRRISDFAERKILNGAILYYKMPHVVLAPNPELVKLLADGTNRTGFLMGRGVEAEKFNPRKRTVSDTIVRLGFVGRLRPEKNVRILIEVEKALMAMGLENFRFLIVGDGSEREHLQQNLNRADFKGFLDGEDLAEAYANMDIFLFPSETDTYGNVIQEAAASGVPSIVSDKGGPKYVVRHGVTGFVNETIEDFVGHIVQLIQQPERLNQMRIAARQDALERSWNSVFDGVYRGYAEAVRIAKFKNRAPNFQKTGELIGGR